MPHKLLLITYWVTCRNHPKEIELCGIFRDVAQFDRRVQEEQLRGWTVTRHEVIKIHRGCSQCVGTCRHGQLRSSVRQPTLNK